VKVEEGLRMVDIRNPSNVRGEREGRGREVKMKGGG